MESLENKVNTISNSIEKVNRDKANSSAVSSLKDSLQNGSFHLNVGSIKVNGDLRFTNSNYRLFLTNKFFLHCNGNCDWYENTNSGQKNRGGFTPH